MSCTTYSCISGEWSCCLSYPLPDGSNRTLVEELVSKAIVQFPPDTNPFQYSLWLVTDSRFLEAPLSIYIILMAFALIHILVMLVCFVILILPYIRSKNDRGANQFWLIKKIYIENQENLPGLSTPLILLNSGVIMAYSQLFESLLSEIYVFLNFFAARSHSLVLKIPFRALNVAVTLFQFYAAWAMAWTSICTRVYSKRSYASQVQFWPYKFFRPLVINFFFCSVSIFVTISTPILIYILVDAFHHERSEFDLMLDTLRQGAGVWQTLSASLDSEGVVFAIGSIFAESLKRGHNWTAALLEHASRAKWVSIVWAIMFFVALMFYIIGTRQLLRIIGAEIKGNPPTVEIGVVSADHNDSQITDHYNQMKLKRGFYYLAVHSSLMILSLMFNIITRIILAVKSFEALVNTTWAIAFSWLILVSGLFSAIATTFQCWRLYVDFDIIIPVEQHDFGSSHNSSIDEGVEEMQETTMAISPSVTKQSYTLVIREEPTMDISPGTRRPSYNPAIREETEPSISD